MSQEEISVAGITKDFQYLAAKSENPPSRDEIIQGWVLISALNRVSGLREPHTPAIIHSIRTGRKPDHNEASLGIMGLNLATKGLGNRMDGRLLINLSENDKEVVIGFATSMIKAVDELFGL